jgi:serine/threonine protein kinase
VGDPALVATIEVLGGLVDVQDAHRLRAEGQNEAALARLAAAGARLSGGIGGVTRGFELREARSLLSRAIARFDAIASAPSAHLATVIGLTPGHAASPGGSYFKPPSGLERGAGVDHFEIIDLIGQGGMGEVYLALDRQLHRKIALKLVATQKAGLFDLEQEARITARLRHPNIVTVHAVGRYGDRPYVALEYVPGGTLRARMSQGPLPEASAVTIALAIAEALAHSHERGVLHRDLKPVNVLIDQDGRARVADFGVAAIVDADPSSEETAVEVERRGDGSNEPPRPLVGGTPSYMAPERWESSVVLPAADVWALGVILFEMLAGRHPFRMGSSTSIVAAIRSREPPELPASVASPELGRLVSACLDRNPHSRPTAKEVVQTLSSFAASITNR